MANIFRSSTSITAQMKDREQRERSWKKFRRDVEKRSYNGRLGFLIGARF
jgi:hypothetical protein